MNPEKVTFREAGNETPLDISKKLRMRKLSEAETDENLKMLRNATLKTLGAAILVQAAAAVITGGASVPVQLTAAFVGMGASFYGGMNAVKVLGHGVIGLSGRKMERVNS